MRDLQNVLHIDLETQSAVDIRNVLNYVNHPTTRVLSVVGRYKGETTVWIPRGRAPHGFGRIDLVEAHHICLSDIPPFPVDIPWVAHNAYGFDALVWDRLYPGHKPIQWLDTMPLCRAARLPAGLEKVSRILFNEGKSEHGKQVIDALCTAKYVAGKVWYPIGTIPLWIKLIEYNIRDTLLLERLWNVVAPQFHEWEYLAIDWTINRRGVRFDRKLLECIIEAWGKIQGDAFDYIADITNGELSGHDLRSPVKVTRWVESKGVILATLNKQYLAEQLEEIENIDPTIVEVLKARQIVSRGSKGKVERLLEIAAVTHGDRLYYSRVFHGAHTGRSTGRGVQPLNLARPIDPEALDKCLTRFDATGELDLGAKPDDRLTELMRPVFCAADGSTLIIGDYSGIEARGLAWLTGEESQLAMFRDNSRDAYKEMAARLFAKPASAITKQERQIGKIVVLGAGYSMSGVKLDLFCKLAKPKVDLKSHGLDPAVVIKTYRQSVPKITAFWRWIEETCIEALRSGYSYTNGKVTVRPSDDMKDLYIQLPSKRSLIYRNARVEDIEPVYVRMYNMAHHTKPTVTYDHPHGYRKSLYGGLITENIVQALCRDIEWDAIARCEYTKYPVVMEVYDEIVCEVPETESEYARRGVEIIMSTVPSWASGFPLKVEVHASRRYNK